MRTVHSVTRPTEHTKELPQVITGVLPQLQRASAFIRGDELGPHTAKLMDQDWFASRLGSSSPPDEKRRAQLGLNLAAAVAGVVLKDDAVDHDEESVGSLLEAHKIVDKDDPLVSPLFVISAVEKVRSLRRFCGEIIAPLANNCTDPWDQYMTTRLLASKPADVSPGSLGEQVRSLQFVHVFSVLDKTENGVVLPFTSKLKSGGFDEFIAEEILDDAAQGKELSSHNATDALSKLLALTALIASSETEPDIIQKLSSDAARQLWPASGIKEIDVRRSQHCSDLKSTAENKKRILEQQCCITSAYTERDMLNAANALKSEITKQAVANGALPRHKLVAARATMRSNGRKRPRPSSANGSANKGTIKKPEVAEPEPKKPRTLVYMNPSGEEILEDSDEFKKFKNDYLSEHPGEPGLEQDIDSIMEHLKTLDLSSGLQRGVQKLHDGENLRRGNRRLRKTYRLKPKDVVGLTMHSKIGPKIRVIFALENGTAVVLGITDKDGASASKSNLGIPGRSRTK